MVLSSGRHHVTGGGFSLPPVAVTYHVKDREWELLDEYRYHDALHGVDLIIPAGFRFDLASIPRIMWRLIAPFELSIVAPLIHDFIYRHAGKMPPGSVVPHRDYTRSEGDKLFDRTMEVEQVSAWRRKPAYQAVRRFGQKTWNKWEKRRAAA